MTENPLCELDALTLPALEQLAVERVHDRLARRQRGLRDERVAREQQLRDQLKLARQQGYEVKTNSVGLHMGHTRAEIWNCGSNT